MSKTFDEGKEVTTSLPLEATSEPSRTLTRALSIRSSPRSGPSLLPTARDLAFLPPTRPSCLETFSGLRPSSYAPACPERKTSAFEDTISIV